MSFGKMVDMSLTPKDQGKSYPMACSPSIGGQPVYPYGLSISLGDEQLAKLDLEADCEIGDIIDLRAMARVTSVSQNETTDGKCCRIELQIIMLGVENEDDEDEEEKPRRKLRSLTYKT